MSEPLKKHGRVRKTTLAPPGSVGLWPSKLSLLKPGVFINIAWVHRRVTNVLYNVHSHSNGFPRRNVLIWAPQHSHHSLTISLHPLHIPGWRSELESSRPLQEPWRLVKAWNKFKNCGPELWGFRRQSTIDNISLSYIYIHTYMSVYMYIYIQYVTIYMYI